MKRFLAAGLAAVCLMLSGCQSWMDGSYVQIKAHEEQQEQMSSHMRQIKNYDDLLKAMTSLVQYGKTNGVFVVGDYDQIRLAADISQAQRVIQIQDPVGAYAVESISTDIGVNAGQTSLAVQVKYRHSKTELMRIKTVSGPEQAGRALKSALIQLRSGLVMKIRDYQDMDFEQMVLDFAMEAPDKVIEVPRVSVAVYPDFGDVRVVELKFNYQTSRESLRNMQNMVAGVFESADLYISGDTSDLDRYFHLYGFLAGRYDYVIETSITPSYSLLCHGVGDSRAFSSVFSAMCSQAGIPCLVVSGSRSGAPWYWNIIELDGLHYHVDLLQSIRSGGMSVRTDKEMTGYVWDYSAYPSCGRPEHNTDRPGNHQTEIEMK